MKLGNFLRTAGTLRQVNPLKVKVRVVKDALSRPMLGEVDAVLCFVDEDSRQGAIVAARKALAAKFPTDNTSDAYLDEFVYQRLFRALRDPDVDAASGMYLQFADTVDELRCALMLPEAQRLDRLYQKFVDEEFPEVVDTATFRPTGDGSDGAAAAATG
jgi:hypothetical protein